MSRYSHENDGKRKSFYPAYAKEQATVKTEGKRRQRWAENFDKENMAYYRRARKYYFIFAFVFVLIVVVAYQIR